MDGADCLSLKDCNVEFSAEPVLLLFVGSSSIRPTHPVLNNHRVRIQVGENFLEQFVMNLLL